jgi:pimeloyl-ACP methyl ester carboxylesterase
MSPTPNESSTDVNGRSEFFTTPSLNGVRLHTLAWGDPSARPLVLLHGGGANAHWWDHLAPALSERFHVVALDFRGHGDSDYPDRVEPGGFHRDLEALLEHLNSPGAALVGHSMGAHIALDHAGEHGRTVSLVAIDVSRGGQAREKRVMRLALAARRTYRSSEEAIERYRFLPPAPLAGETLRLHIAQHSVSREDDGRFGFKFDPRWFSLPRAKFVPLSNVQCRVLIVRGEQSSILTHEGAEAVSSELPAAQLIEIAGAGHNVHLECPDEVLEAILDFL